MNEENQKKVDKFLQECKHVDVFGYSLGVFIVGIIKHDEFVREFNTFNEWNGINFQIVKLPNSKMALSEW
jgi:hypothetical protein